MNDSAPASGEPGFLTIGHSKGSLDEFLDLLDDNGTEAVVDVRKLPGPKADPQFNADVLAEAVLSAGAVVGEDGIITYPKR